MPSMEETSRSQPTRRMRIRYYAELNDYLPPERRFATWTLDIDGRSPVGSLLASQGILIDVVDLILVNGEPAELSYLPKDGDRISVFPVFESFDIAGTTKVRVRALREVRFVLDVHLGKLASHLRMLGFDTLYRNDFTNEELTSLSLMQGRILVSRSQGLIAEPVLTHACRIGSQDPREQLIEVLNRFDLYRNTHPFTRCIACNAILEPTAKERILDRLPPKVAAGYEEFRLCPECDRLYWKGTHFRRMEAFISGLDISLTDHT